MPKNKTVKIIVDTNLWISFILSKKLNQLETLLFTNKIRILFSAELINELQLTILKPKLKKYFPENAIDEMMDVFEQVIDFIEVTSKVAVCRDSKDDFLLALAKDGEADFLLTGDADLLDISKFENTKIIKFKEFIDFNSSK
jgi:putative PIN family toxin of toxin-antitoxin system